MRVQVVMTDAAQRVHHAAHLRGLTGRKVITGSVRVRQPEETLSSAIEHIAVAQDNEVLVIAPATADLLARLAHGLADDFLTTMYLAFTGRVVLAPAMNNNMWTHPATQENLAASAQARAHHRRAGRRLAGLRHDGPGPPGRAGKNRRCGRRLEPSFEHLARDLEGETVLITAGPTQEPLDPVRFISNRSSGKMGYALAEAAVAARRASDPGLGTGATGRAARACDVMHVRTALEMRDAVLEHLSEASIIVKAAAVADYHLAQRAAAQRSRRPRAHVARSRSDARYSGRIGPQERRPAADRLRRGNREPDRERRARSWNRRTATWWWRIW